MIFKLSFIDGRVDWCTAKNQLDLLKSYDAENDLLLQDIDDIVEISDEEAKEELSDRSLSDFLDYEIRSSWWAPYIGWGWLQEICGKYFARKTKRKFERYQTSMEWGQIIEKSQTK